MTEVLTVPVTGRAIVNATGEWTARSRTPPARRRTPRAAAWLGHATDAGELIAAELIAGSFRRSIRTDSSASRA